MQNKPNFLDALMNVTSFYTVDYQNIANCKLGENKPNTNPIKPNFRKAQMNLSSVIRKDYENELLRRLSENKPNTNPNKAIFKGKKILPHLELFHTPGQKVRLNTLLGWKIKSRREFNLFSLNRKLESELVFENGFEIVNIVEIVD